MRVIRPVGPRAEHVLVSVLSAGAVLVGTASTPSGLVATFLALLCVGLARYQQSWRLLRVAAVALVSGLVLTGIGGGSEGALVISTVGAIVLWMQAESVLTESARGGGTAARGDPPLASLVVLLAVGVSGLVALVVYQTVTGGPPPIVVASLLLGAAMLLALSKMSGANRE